ncbi:hypothetical protein CGJ96_23785, partial [Vibrio parahaemolyticus]
NQPTVKTNEATHEIWHVLRLERFKNLSRQYQVADLEKRMLKRTEKMGTKNFPARRLTPH